MSSELLWNDAATRAWLRRRLLCWFDRNARDLPWRHTKNPYHIWVSEIMLQQTLVATVVPYYHRFLKTFPTIDDLAAADEQDVLRMWEGLGYYRRARQLHKAAKVIVETNNGVFPSDAATVAALPGFGRYTLGAVLSQAFDERLPILEANSIRVLCRMFAIEGVPARSPTQRLLWRIAEAVLPRKRVGDFNQSLMELGALVCKPEPNCNSCPLKNRCEAKRLGVQNVLPTRDQKRPIEEFCEVAVVVRRDGKVLIVQRPDGGRWAGMWEFPHGPVRNGESHQSAAERILQDNVGVAAKIVGELTNVRHSITHHRIRMACLAADYQSGEVDSRHYTDVKWVLPDALAEFPLSSPQRRLAKTVTQPVQPDLFVN